MDRRQRYKEQTRAEVVQAAFDLFGKHGFDNVPVEAICEAAGISRATFFNYFPQKELVLEDFAKARFAKLKGILQTFEAASHAPALEDGIELFLRISDENAVLAGHNRRLLLELILRQVSRGTILATKREAVQVLARFLSRVARRNDADPELVANTLFSIYIATTLEWLMQEDTPPEWLHENMRARMELALEGIRV